MLFRSGVCAIANRFPSRACAAAILLAGGLLVAGCDREKAASGQEEGGQANVSARQGDPTGPAYGPSAAKYSVDRSRAGRMAPGAAITGPDDGPGEKTVTLADFRGRPLLVNLWATWCAPCIKEMPTLNALAAQTYGKLAVIAVAQDIQGAEVVDPWFQRAGLKQLQPYLDPDNAMLDAAGTGALPLTVLYDAKGREVWRVIGPMDWTGPEARALLAEGGVGSQ